MQRRLIGLVRPHAERSTRSSRVGNGNRTYGVWGVETLRGEIDCVRPMSDGLQIRISVLRTKTSVNRERAAAFVARGISAAQAKLLGWHPYTAFVAYKHSTLDYMADRYRIQSAIMSGLHPCLRGRRVRHSHTNGGHDCKCCR